MWGCVSHSWFGMRTPGCHQHPHGCASRPSSPACPPPQGPKLLRCPALRHPPLLLGTAARAGASCLEEQVGQDCSFLLGALGCSWLVARAMVAEAQDDEAGPPLPAPPCSCILSAPLRGSPTSPLVQPRLRARKHEGYVGSGCGHLRQPRRDGPTLRVSHRPPASTWTRAVTAKFLYCLKQSRWNRWPQGHHMYRRGRLRGVGAPQGLRTAGQPACGSRQFGHPISHSCSCTWSWVGGHTPVPPATMGTHQDPLPRQGQGVPASGMAFAASPLRLLALPVPGSVVGWRSQVPAMPQTMLCLTPGS